MIEAVVLRPLPYRDPGRIVLLADPQEPEDGRAHASIPGQRCGRSEGSMLTVKGLRKTCATRYGNFARALDLLRSR